MLVFLILFVLEIKKKHATNSHWELCTRSQVMAEKMFKVFKVMSQ